ncbi:MAG: tripartite tricarboxylate transporter substrate binding protein [Roseomonas sp.]|nr:tripartite tricarboxylate transporter substrate binding protein [Roseomonas sp.]MCA3315742.1 tripartite tricarboxylate transporter substrate binding protein [Roseomonas sp.]MCA3319678.1 tripartite tricarboxylate transporter substrate binding protein [Roseomonas sp.]
MRKLLRRSLLSGFAAVSLLPLRAKAQQGAWPTRPIRLVVPFTPAGATDLLARILADAASRALGQPIIIENRPGAGGNIGTAMVANAPGDGYTVLIVDPGAVAISPSVPPGVPYDPLRDFEPVTQLVNSATAFVGRANLPARDLKALIDQARAAPGQFSCGTVGQNSTTHLAMMVFEKLAGVSLLHVPYAGASPAMTDLLGGRIDLAFVGGAGAAAHIREGRLLGLGVTTAKPAPGLPDVPPLSATLPEFDAAGWFCLLVPRGTPSFAIEKLHQAFAGALQNAEVQKALAQSAFEAVGSTPAEFAARLRRDITRYAELLRSAGATTR